MRKNINRIVLRPSGLNSHFCGENLSFDNYINLMQNIILESRQDLNDEDAGKIILANSPFSFKPQYPAKVKNGLLLIHGLYDSPFYLKDLGNHFHKKGYLVNAILLPGHGTVPGDLLDLDHREWLKAVRYGIAKLTEECENIFLAGYSLGGLLVLNDILNNREDKIKGILLFAPAIKPKYLLSTLLAKYHKLFTWVSPYAKWYRITRQNNNYAKYTSYTFNAGYQVCKIMDTTNTLLIQKNVQVPIFLAISSDDETISYQAILSFFMQQPHPKNKLLIYTNYAHQFDDKRVITKSSYFPHMNIISFSHSCLTISPDNPLLGFSGEHLNKGIYLGATTKINFKKYISKLSYNPDFENLLNQLDEFLASISNEY